MTDLSSLSRRERQIMEIVFAEGEATVAAIQARLPQAPGDMAIRRLLQILEEKGLVSRRKRGRENVYRPRQSKQRVARKALKQLLDTFFAGSIDDALACHLAANDPQISDEQLARMQKLIRKTREQHKSE